MSERAKRRWTRVAARPRPAQQYHTALRILPYMPEEAWGQTLVAVPGLPRHVAIRAIGAHRAAVVCARCDGCGGRHDGLVDVGAGNRERTAAQLADLAERFSGRLTRVMDTLAGTWVEEHGACDHDPRRRPLTHSISEFVDGVRVLAQDWLLAEAPGGASLHVLTAAGACCSLPYPEDAVLRNILGLAGRSPVTTERRPVARLVPPLVRRLAGQSGCHVVAAAVVRTAPAYGAGDGVHPRDALGITLVTEDHGRIGIASIARRNGGSRSTTSPLGALDWRPLRGESPWVDGALARPEYGWAPIR